MLQNIGKTVNEIKEAELLNELRELVENSRANFTGLQRIAEEVCLCNY